MRARNSTRGGYRLIRVRLQAGAGTSIAHAAYAEPPASAREFGAQDRRRAVPLPGRAGQWDASPLDRARPERLLERRKRRLELIRAPPLAMHRELPAAGAFA